MTVRMVSTRVASLRRSRAANNALMRGCGVWVRGSVMLISERLNEKISDGSHRINPSGLITKVLIGGITSGKMDVL